ncbi:hypothetical protein HZS_2939 [Henneguya salminicola]|nr:hypothetical protein HZS_2939 [Henneguya salminicola]
MENLVTLIDFIRENLHRTNIHIEIDLPQIVVVGEQSSGKSSVLESIVGREFLPKGNGIVTRRPIKNNGTGTNSTPEFGIFSHIQGKKFENFNDIEAEINNSTNFLLGNTQNISRDPIFLKIFSPRVVNLTLIDLPGLTKIPLIDQPNNISEKLHGIVSEYISNPNSIILAIIPAITDILIERLEF